MKHLMKDKKFNFARLRSNVITVIEIINSIKTVVLTCRNLHVKYIKKTVGNKTIKILFLFIKRSIICIIKIESIVVLNSENILIVHIL